MIAYEALDENIRYLKAAATANRLEERITIRNVVAWDRVGHVGVTGDSAWGRVILGNGENQTVASMRIYLGERG